jgi:hypothetical protein
MHFANAKRAYECLQVEEEHSKRCIQYSRGRGHIAYRLIPNRTVTRFVESSEMPKRVLHNAPSDWMGCATLIILTTDAANDLSDGRQEPKV